MEYQKPLKVYAAIVLSMMFFAVSFVWFKQANVSYGPLTIVLSRLIISALIIFLYTKVFRKLVVPDKKDFKYLLLLTFFEPFLYFMGESFGLQYLSSTVASVIIAMVPLVAPVAAFLFFKEKISLKNLLGIFISFIGVTLVIVEIGVGMTASPIGVLLQFGAVIAAVGYTVVLQNISNRMNTISIILFQNIIGSVYFFPFWFAFEKNWFFSTAPDWDAIWAIVYLAIFASTFAFIFLTYSVRYLGITKANMFTNMIPVFTALFSWLILDEWLSVQKTIGIAMVIGGLFVAQWGLKRRFKKHLPVPRT
ncbi:MAG: DMT family transporter [Prolixibacteraceae bacterium]|nr:DMT family transporter [Prolixibacteraceae bacterium]MBN2649142.1 DMT family transporter [Prolixibacteraceae bacterium]